MNRLPLIVAAAVWLSAFTVSRAFDTVKASGSSAIGQVVKMSKLQVVVKQGSTGAEKTMPVNQIETIRYDEEPAMLNTARTAISAGRYEDALAALERINLAEIKRAEIKQDIEFYKALCAARLALAGNGNIVEAGKLMAAFVNNNPDNYHYLEACEVVGDLLVAIGNHATAKTYYDQLANTPWPDYQMRAGVASGRAQLADGKIDDALKSFQAVLDIQAKGGLADRQRLAATLGKARCLAEQQQFDDAIKLAEGIIDKAGPEQSELLAQAYNTVGVAYRKAGRSKDALLAFLHVDVLYFSSANEHIEALQNLIELWNEIQKPQRAAEAAQILRDRYKVSPRAQ